MNKLKEILGAVAPTVATALGGPYAGLAVKALADKLGLDTKNKKTDEVAEEIRERFESPQDPEIWLKAKQAEQEFEKGMAELGIRRDQLILEDKRSARERQVATGDETPQVLAYLTIAIFALVIAGLFFVDIDPEVRTLIDVMLGILLATVKSVYDYFFGSSLGSKQKTAIIGNGKQ